VQAGVSRQAVIKKLLRQALDRITVRSSARKRRAR
jgi:hypothetical protein